MIRIVLLLLCLSAAPTTCLAQAPYPTPVEGDVTLRDFRFKSNETLPELRLHYRTIGRLERDAKGVARNAVLIMHGTGGSGAQFLRAEFADDLINPPELQILETEIRRVPGGKALVIPFGPETVGHGTHTLAKVWEQHLAALMKQSEWP